jgi:negative regulator of sigma E activity
MQLFLQLQIAALAIWLSWALIRKMLRPRAPAEPAEDPFAEVSAPLKRNPKGRTGAVAIEEPEEGEYPDAYPPRTL